MKILLNIIAIFLISWMLSSTIILAFHAFSKNDNSKINNFFDKYPKAIFLGSLVFLVQIIGSGLSDFLFFVNKNWGIINNIEKYNSYNISISYTISTVLSFGIIYLLVSRYDYKKNENLIIEENKKKLKLSYFLCKIHFEEDHATCVVVRDKISYLKQTYIDDEDLSDNEDFYYDEDIFDDENLSDEQKEILKIAYEAEDSWYALSAVDEDGENVTSDACLDLCFGKDFDWDEFCEETDINYSNYTPSPKRIEDTSWHEKILTWADSNEISDLQAETDSIEARGYINNKWWGVPRDIEFLLSLKELKLCGEDASNLPKEIGKLTNLSSVVLIDAGISQLPKEFFNLTELVQLILTDNFLTELPKEIGNLTKLFELDLYGNKLINIPREIGNLVNLTSLDLRENKLTELPKEISMIPKLAELKLKGNLIDIRTQIEVLEPLQKRGCNIIL